MDNLIHKIDKIIIFFIVYSLTFSVFFKILGYTLPFVLAFIFAIILKRPSDILTNKFKIKQSISSLIVTLIFFTAITFLLYIGIAAFIKESVQLGKNIQFYLSNNTDNISIFFENINIYYKNLDPSITIKIQNSLISSISKISNYTMAITSRIVQAILSFLSYIPYLLMLILFTLISTYFFTKDITSAKSKVLSILSNKKSDKIYNLIYEFKKMLTNYALSYLLLIAITFIETLIVFLVFRIKYAVILSILAAIFDILPILGIGGIYVPLILIHIFIYKNYFISIALVVSYVLVTIIRQIVEPKLVSSSLGIHPVSVLAAIFIGLKANGISGMFFCMFLVIIYKILKTVKII